MLQKVFQILRLFELEISFAYLHEVDTCIYSKDLLRLLPILLRRDKGYRLTACGS